MARKLTMADQSAARRLRALWDSRPKERRESQAQAAEALDMSEGAVSQYLLGKVPLGIKATHRWAAYLDVDPRDIRPDIDEMIGREDSKAIDEQLLSEILSRIDTVLNQLKLDLDPKTRGRIAALLYSHALKSGGISTDMIEGMVKLASQH